MIAVACAIVEHKGNVLVTKRGLYKSEGGLWEFPGGKLEAGETAEACIVREIAEELDLKIQPYKKLAAAEHRYPTKTIRLIPLICHWVSGTMQLREHAAFQWVSPAKLPELNWCPADIPIVDTYLQWLQQQQA